jgi:hypothetical protein
MKNKSTSLAENNQLFCSCRWSIALTWCVSRYRSLAYYICVRISSRGCPSIWTTFNQSSSPLLLPVCHRSSYVEAGSFHRCRNWNIQCLYCCLFFLWLECWRMVWSLCCDSIVRLFVESSLRTPATLRASVSVWEQWLVRTTVDCVDITKGRCSIHSICSWSNSASVSSSIRTRYCS